MKTTTDKAVTAYKILNGARLTDKMTDDDKFAVIGIMKVLKPVAVNYDDFYKDAVEKLKPEGIEPVLEKINRQQPLTGEEQSMAALFDRTLGNCVAPELNKEIELDFEPLNEEAMKGLISGNNFTVSQVMALYDIIGE